VIGHRQSSMDKLQAQGNVVTQLVDLALTHISTDTHRPPLRIHNSDFSSESVDTLHIPNARPTSALPHPNSPYGTQRYYDKGYPAPAISYNQAFYGATPQERSRWATANTER
jgi:hypothetical protein